MDLISELLGYRQYTDKTLPQFLQILKNRGIDISSGAFAVAIVSPTVVYKLWLNDFAYDSYLKKIIVPLQGNPYVPKILKRVRMAPVLLKDQQPGIKVLAMERLEPEVKQVHVWPILVYKLFQLKLSYGQLKTMKASEQKKYNIKYVLEELAKLSEEQIVPFEMWFNRCVTEMAHFKPDENYLNVMYRGETPVFIDPFTDKADIRAAHNKEVLTLSDFGSKLDWSALNSKLI